jgi:hypothetical protein
MLSCTKRAERCSVIRVFFKLWGQATWRVLHFRSRKTFEWWLDTIGSMEPTAIIVLGSWVPVVARYGAARSG